MYRLFIILLFLIGHFVCAQQETDKLIRKSIYFGGGSYYIDELQKDELRNFLSDFESFDNYEIVIFSHTDNIGGKEYNEWLSMMRSHAVVYELIQHGIPDDIIEKKDFGQENPLYTNQSWDGRLMNRRVDVILVPLAF